MLKNDWLKILVFIKEQVTAANFRTWFSKTSGRVADGKLTITVPSAFIKNQLIARYEALIKQAMQESLGNELLIDFEINPSLAEKTSSEPPEDIFAFSYQQSAATNTSLSSKYTLDSFVVGPTNNLAYAAAQAVAQNPGTSYNPLFIYGLSGVGKTHLMQGIGNSVLNKNPYQKLIYASCERFMVDFVDSLQNKRTGDFRQKYRACDILLIDDVQFISGKDSTQEEFFHTFNELHSKNSQIILTSDRPPNEIMRLESRLMSRFQGGLMVDIQLPDLETRMAILKAKLLEKGESLPEEILQAIAENVVSNTRELEGKLTQVLQFSKLTPEALTRESLSRVLGQSTKPQQQAIDHKKVISQINQYFNIKLSDLLGPRRNKELVLPRHLAMYIMYEQCALPMEKIGELLGGRDHTTVLHAIEKVRLAITRDREIQRLLVELKNHLSN